MGVEVRAAEDGAFFYDQTVGRCLPVQMFPSGSEAEEFLATLEADIRHFSLCEIDDLICAWNEKMAKQRAKRLGGNLRKEFRKLEAAAEAEANAARATYFARYGTANE